MKNTCKLYKFLTVFVMTLAYGATGQVQAASVPGAITGTPSTPVSVYVPIVDAVYQVRHLAGGPAVLKLTELVSGQATSAVVSNTGTSYKADMKVGPVSGKLYIFYLEKNITNPALSMVKLDIRSNISTSMGVHPFPLPSGALTIKSSAVAVKTVGSTEEIHGVVLAETSTQARVYYSRLTATGWTAPIIPYFVSLNSRRFGTNVKMEFVSPTSTEVMITYPELESTASGTLGNIVTWKFNTAHTLFPPTPFLRTPVNSRVWGGEIVNSTIPKVGPMDFMTDPTTGNTVITVVPARLFNSHVYPEAGIDVYSGNSSNSMSFVRTMVNTNTTGPWGSGALTLVAGSTQKIFKMVTLEQGSNLGYMQLGLGGKEIKIYTSPQGTAAPTSQLIDALSLTAGQQYFTYPAATTSSRYNETYAGVIYDNSSGSSSTCSGVSDPLCHQVRVYSLNGTSWSHEKLDSAPTTHKIENLVITSR